MYMNYYTRGVTIYFCIMDDKDDTRGVVTGSDNIDQLGIIAERFNVRMIERID